MNLQASSAIRKILNRMLGPLGAIAAIGGFVGDVLQPLFDIAPWVAGFSLATFVGSLVALVIYRRTSTVELAESLIPAVLVLSAGSTLIFAGYSVLWNEAPERGFLAANVEPVSRAQASLLGLEEEIAEISEAVDRTEEIVSDTAVEVDENQALLEQIIDNQTGPVTMPDGKLLNIAVAQFGTLADGTMSKSETGRNTSAMIFNRLCDEFLEPEEICDQSEDPATPLSQLYGDSIALWHDSMALEFKGAELGMVTGADAAARAQSAEDLAERVNANIVIYGYVQSENGSDTVYTEVYFKGDKTRSEPDALAGTHEIGQPVTLLFPEGHESRPTELREALRWRTQALAWITAGLTDDVSNNREAALATFQQASDSLADWEDDRGRATIEYFIGRQAFFLRDYETAFAAFQKSIELNPTYPNAQVALGATYYDHAQLYFLRDIPDFQSDCVSQAAIERSAGTLLEAELSMSQAQKHIEEAIRVAPNSPYPATAGLAHMMMGQNDRLIAQTRLFAGDLDQARTLLDSSLYQFQLAQQAFTGSNEFVYRGMAHDGTGGTWTLVAQTELQRGNQAAATDAWNASIQSYEMCLAEEANMPTELFDLMAKVNVFNCGCRDSLELIKEYVGSQ